MKDHKRRTHDKREYKCDQCDFTVLGNNSLQTHKRVHQQVKCPECNIEIKRNSLNVHLSNCKTRNQIQHEKINNNGSVSN